MRERWDRQIRLSAAGAIATALSPFCAIGAIIMWKVSDSLVVGLTSFLILFVSSISVAYLFLSQGETN